MSTSFSEIMLLVFPASVIPALFLKRQNLNSKNWDYLRNRIRTLDHLCSAAPKVHVVLEMILPIKKEKALLTLRCLAKAILVAFRHRLTKVGPPRKLWEFPVAANMSPLYYNHSQSILMKKSKVTHTCSKRKRMERSKRKINWGREKLTIKVKLERRLAAKLLKKSKV